MASACRRYCSTGKQCTRTRIDGRAYFSMDVVSVLGKIICCVLLNYILCRLPLIIFHYTKIEVFEWPSKRKWPCKTNEMHKLLPALYYACVNIYTSRAGHWLPQNVQ